MDSGWVVHGSVNFMHYYTVSPNSLRFFVEVTLLCEEIRSLFKLSKGNTATNWMILHHLKWQKTPKGKHIVSWFFFFCLESKWSFDQNCFRLIPCSLTNQLIGKLILFYSINSPLFGNFAPINLLWCSLVLLVKTFHWTVDLFFVRTWNCNDVC